MIQKKVTPHLDHYMLDIVTTLALHLSHGGG